MSTAKILIVDDDQSMRRLIRLNLTDLYDVTDTGQPEQALALALENRPDAILLDLRMPGYSGFELCKTFTTFSATQLIPIFVISGEGGAKTKDFCRELGAAAYFEKPVDFQALRSCLADALQKGRKERRHEVRVSLRVPLKLSGKDSSGKSFELPTTTENVSRSAYLCACAAVLQVATVVDVHLLGSQMEHVGSASVVRTEWPGTQYPRYAFTFTEMIGSWVLQ
jgi:DNA-binding response OmpR family regulator